MRAKFNTPEDYFNGFLGKQVWAKAVRALARKEIAQFVEDGFYAAELTGSRFENLIKSTPTFFLIFKITATQQLVQKQFALTGVTGTADLLTELIRFGFIISSPNDMAEISNRIKEAKPNCKLLIKTSEGIQNIEIRAHRGASLDNGNQPALVTTAEAVPSLARAENIDPESSLSVSDEVLTIPEPEKLKEGEVDIQVGMKVRFRENGKTSDGVVLQTFDEEMEMSVHTIEGDIIIKADSVVWAGK